MIIFKRSIVILTLLVLCLNIANANDDIVNKNLNVLKEEAIKAYKNKDYEDAYDKFSQIFLSTLSDSKVNFLLGRSAYEIGKYEMALAAFERVQILDPLNSRNDLELGRTQYKLEMYEDSKINFKKVLKNPNLPETVRKNIEIFLSKIDDKLNNLFYTINARIGLIYDNNVNYGSINSTITYNSIDILTEEIKKSMATEFQTSFSSIYDVGEKDGVELRTQALLYNKEYVEDDSKENNITYLSFSPGMIYQDLYTTYELSFLLDKMYTDGDDYLTALSFAPAVTQKLDAQTSLIFGTKYTDKAFQKNNDNLKDSRYYELGLTYQKILANSYYSIKSFFSKEARKNDKDPLNININVNNISYGLSANYTTQFFSTYVISINAGVKAKKFDDENSSFNSKRKDDSYSIGLNLSKRISSNIQVESKIDYERNFSNQGLYSYDKGSFGLFFNVAF